MKRSFPIRPASYLVLALFLAVAPSRRAGAGLVIRVDPAIDVRKVQDLAIDRGSLVVVYSDADKPKNLKVINLPPGMLHRIAAWAQRGPCGPVVISGDRGFITGLVGETFSQEQLEYFPPYLDLQLGRALRNYDQYAVQVALGSSPPGGFGKHPLVVRSKDVNQLPARRLSWLLARENLTSQAILYRRLAAQYTGPPGFATVHGSSSFIGQLTIFAEGAAGGFPVRLRVESNRRLGMSKWYRATDVPSEVDRATSTLPYAPLQKDMEEHWEEYRQVFPGLHEASSLVEAYAVLQGVFRQNVPLWKKFMDRLSQGLDEVDFPPLEDLADWRELGANLSPSYADLGRWRAMSIESIGDEVETGAQANMALTLIYEGRVERALQLDWLEDVEVLARDSPVLQARLALLEALQSDAKDEAYLQAKRFFDLTRALPDGFRLRAQGLHRLSTYATQKGRELDEIARKRWKSLQSWVDEALARYGELKSLLSVERSNILDEFRRRVAAAAARDEGGEPDFATWEGLEQDIYSVDLLILAKEDARTGPIAREVLQAVAEVHYRRGMAPQKGMDLDFCHAHFRFLRYLTLLRPDDQDFRKTVRGYRAQLAAKMGLRDWGEDS